MKLLVIGAAGKTGAAIVQEAVAAGHTVTAFVHNASGFAQTGLRVIEGDASDPARINEAVAGQDAVLDALGGKTPYKESTLETDSARIIVDAMRNHAVRRLLVVSALGEGESRANTSFLYEHILMPTFLRGVMKDKAGMESEVAASDLNFTIVRAALLTDGPLTGKVRTFEPEEAETAHKISRADLARFLVEQVGSSQYARQAVTVATE